MNILKISGKVVYAYIITTLLLLVFNIQLEPLFFSLLYFPCIIFLFISLNGTFIKGLNKIPEEKNKVYNNPTILYIALIIMVINILLGITTGYFFVQAYSRADFTYLRGNTFIYLFYLLFSINISILLCIRIKMIKIHK